MYQNADFIDKYAKFMWSYTKLGVNHLILLWGKRGLYLFSALLLIPDCKFIHLHYLLSILVYAIKQSLEAGESEGICMCI